MFDFTDNLLAVIQKKNKKEKDLHSKPLGCHREVLVT